ncbi:Uncharacterised protein [Mycobacteroides abscessus]|nr:Uncharacterised protein [Mycobacteroides abscessus]
MLRAGSRASSSSSRSSSGTWPATTSPRARASANQPARSSSGNSCMRPERGGHSSANVLLAIVVTSRSASRAHAATSLPARWRTVPRSRSGAAPAGAGTPSSSANSRSAAACSSSPGSTSPLGIVHPPASLRAHSGPPMCPRSTSTASARNR